MNRRQFLATAASGLSLTPADLSGDQAKAEEVTKVHVIFKTHLDVGFTAPAAEVIRTYYEQFIPKVLALTEQMQQNAEADRYIWTTGSWLVYTYLESASAENRARMERAIEAGNFVWHALPFTTHTELADPSLYALGLQYSARLDHRFSRTTISAKMTDVPGHTRSVIPVLTAGGVAFLHVGVNGSSRPPDVPPVFLWRSPEGSELIVMYHHEYGGVTILPGGTTAVSVNFTGDNHGPHTPQQIAEIYSGLRRRFPNAKVAASNFNAVAQELIAVRPKLPVVTQEIGDTWIHGAGSDPLRMAEFRELSRLRRSWLASGALSAGSDIDLAFGGRLLRIAEHTWGLDIKTFLKHWDAYDMPAFRSARSLPEFQRVEASWKEKRATPMAARGTRSVRPLSGKSTASPSWPRASRRHASSSAACAASSAGTYQVGTPVNFSSRKSTRASSRTTTQYFSSMSMKGRNSARFSPSLYRSRGARLDVATITTPSSNSRVNSRPRIIASAMSVTWNSSKHSSQDSSAIASAARWIGSRSGLPFFISWR